MRSGITRQALRRHRWSLLGPACTQLVAAAVISMMIMTAASVNRAALTPTERRSQQVTDIVATTEVFIGVAVYMSIVIVGVTMNLAMGRQLRDVALLRAIGASPGQIRRSVALQAGAVAVPASVGGFLVAIPGGAVWVAALRANDVMPDAVRFTPQWQALPIVAGIVLATSVAGTMVAAHRASRVPPVTALTETSTGRRQVRPVRTFVGALLVVAGLVLSAILAQFSPQQVSDAGFFVMLAECVGVGMLGPTILRFVARVLSPAAPRGVPRLALDNITAMTRPLSGALIPLVLAVAFAGVKIATHTTTAHATGVSDPVSDVWTDYSGTAIYCVFAAVAALNCLITVLVGRGRDLAAMQLAGATRRALVAMACVETVVITMTAFVVAAGVAVATLVPILHTTVGAWLPHVPGSVIAGGVVVLGAVVAAGIVVPAAVLTKRPAVKVARLSE